MGYGLSQENSVDSVHGLRQSLSSHALLCPAEVVHPGDTLSF